MLGPDQRPLRFHEENSEWLRSFSMEDMKVLVVCRGPVRMEAFEIFESMGIREYGMLLSEKDSIVYPRCLAPEIRSIPNQQNIHRVNDYMGAGQEEKIQRIKEIVEIARVNQYTHIFAGYGFMAEEADFIQAIEDAGIGFLGPSASVIRKAGAKDEAKKLARNLGNAVIPGIDDISSRALITRVENQGGLEALCAQHELDWEFDGSRTLEENAEALLQAGYSQSLELVTIEELQVAAQKESRIIWEQYPGKRIRYKCIGGGGGKGQRVAQTEEDVPEAVMEILAEQKVLEPGSNRNFLIELNLETTRHNEIQVIGNGEWALALGGRDCSIQMREQKQLEFSLTQELITEAVSQYEGVQKETLQRDSQTLKAMEEDSERFAEGVGLDSVSTFECIVEGFDHFFMEMNTRIQVEHGVTELAYLLRFTNPDNPDEYFYLDRLIEAMALLAVHGKRVPQPERVPRYVSGAEIRVNATNAALQPHAGGLIRQWSSPLSFEIRDDQGIGTRNPDTGSFMYYNLAGAYDSNITLILSHGEDRKHNLERLSEILRRTELRGDNLETNIPVQYGLINWTIGLEPMMKPNTRFLTHYLAAVGSLQIIARDVDLGVAAAAATRKLEDPAARTLLAKKETLLLRPIGRLLEDPHALAGFIGRHHGHLWQAEGDEVTFVENPIHLLQELYHYLNMDFEEGKPASEMIWQDDLQAMTDAMEFYAEIGRLTKTEGWADIDALFSAQSCDAVSGGDADLWERCKSAHAGHQLGMELLLMIPRIGIQSGFSEITVNEKLEPVFPKEYLDPEVADDLIRALSPPPPASSDEIVTPMAGTYYCREAPHLPALVEEGQHFEVGQPLFIIEVMKMFNKIVAPFAGTLTRDLMKDSDGQIVAKGERLFEIEPDETPVIETEEEIAERRSGVTLGLLG
ncbi:MAG: biotin carboxylase N-terminal domain-containing protein [Myxococcota bacterium]|nr:biotin carboxylase [Spirochaeta sp.]RPG12386.1 MAG: biotin carboxylase [Proteobacteria bacterium TMED72]